MGDFADLEIGLYRRDPDNHSVELRFRQPDDEAEPAPDRGVARFAFADLRRYLLQPDVYGQRLRESLCADPAVHKALDRALTAAEAADRTLRLRLMIDRSAPELHNVRWETLRDPRDDAWILTNPRVLFSRYLRSGDYRPVRLRPKGDLTALVVIANPNDVAQYVIDEDDEALAVNRTLAPMKVDAELARATHSLGAVARRTIVSDPAEPGRASLRNIVAALREGYDILYLMCHGALMRDTPTGPQQPRLWLEGDDGSSEIVAADTLVEHIRDLLDRPRLIVLASCESAGHGVDAHSMDRGALSAVGPRLAEAGVPAVVAMQGNVLMQTVDRFMPVFFTELLKDGQIDRAMAAARGAVRDAHDAWAPVLFMRLRNGRIWYVPGFTDAQAPFDHWSGLLGSIQKGKCTPIVGSGAIEFLLGSSRDIAQRWSETENFPLSPRSQDDLPQVAQYLASEQGSNHPRDKLEEYVSAQLRERHGDDLAGQAAAAPLDVLVSIVGARRRQRDEFEPHRVLAQLPLPVYITTNPDDLLADALREAGKQPQVEICRWKDSLAAIPSVYDVERDYRPTVQRPLVFHLFGHLSQPASIVLTEDDYFDYLMWVNNTDDIPNVVTSAWSANALLFLGFRMDDWNFRVLFRSIMNEERRYRPRGYKSIAVQIGPEEGSLQPQRARRYLEKFFQGANIATYWGNADDFARDLWRQWKPRIGQ
jgi:hypothetical protein